MFQQATENADFISNKNTAALQDSKLAHSREGNGDRGARNFGVLLAINETGIQLDVSKAYKPYPP